VQRPRCRVERTVLGDRHQGLELSRVEGLQHEVTLMDDQKVSLAS
jgi:hypothetical protein